jgi:hypothetical protein
MWQVKNYFDHNLEKQLPFSDFSENSGNISKFGFFFVFWIDVYKIKILEYRNFLFEIDSKITQLVRLIYCFKRFIQRISKFTNPELNDQTQISILKAIRGDIWGRNRVS